MTPRGVSLLLGGLAFGVAGWLAGWPELTALGASALALVVCMALAVSWGSAVAITVDSNALRVVRGEPAVVKVGVSARGARRALRLVEGAPAHPVRTVPIPRGRSEAVVLDVPVATDKRGLHPLGPFTVVRGDAWSIWRTSVTTAPEGSLLVRPRTYPVRKGFAAAMRQGDSEAMSRRHGEDHFFALRDYVLGDEPRNVHWRSSARSGRLVVRQKVAAAVDGTLLVLDTDATAYASADAFSGGFLEERFEAAVEVIASLCLSRANDGQHVQLATTSLRQPTIRQGASAQGLIDALAVVSAVIPIETSPSQLPALARRGKCSQVIIVTGSPSAALCVAVRQCGSLSPVLVRVGGVPSVPVSGAKTVDVADAAGLA